MKIVYKITNKKNGKIYIGKTINDSVDYFGSGKLIRRAIEKYGIENFYKETIDSANTVDELNNKEKFWIQKYDSMNLKIGYNIAEGGNGGDLFTNNPNKELIRKKYSHKGKENPMFGKKHTLESKRKISLHKIGQRKGIPTWNKGLKFSDYSLEYKDKLIKYYRNRKGKNNPTSKKYLIISPDGREFILYGTINEFAKKNGFFPTTLRYFCNKGRIPLPKRKCTKQRTCLTGWKITKIDVK